MMEAENEPQNHLPAPGLGAEIGVLKSNPADLAAAPSVTGGGEKSGWRGLVKTSSLGAIFVFALALGALAACYAIFEARDFDADGPFDLLLALSRGGGLHFGEPARISVQFLQQSFSWLAYRTGGTDLLTYGRLLTLGMQGWPLLLTGLSWFILPRDQKRWILGPLLNIAVVIPTTSFMGVGEGMIASCLMWLLYFLVEFRMQGWLTGVLAFVLATCCFNLHESAFPFLLGIALLSLSRVPTARGFAFVFSILVALAAFAASIHLFYLVLFPRDSFERGAFLAGLLVEFLVTLQGPGFNLPTVASLALATCLLLVHFPRHLSEEERRRRVLKACKVSGGIFGIIALLFLALPEWVIIPHAYFAARGLPVIATTIMAGMIHFMLRAGWTTDRLLPEPVRLLLIAIIPLQFLMQIVMTQHWASYRRDLADLVATHTGVIEWNVASETINPHHTFFRRHLLRAWSVEPLSMVLAPDDRVRAIVDTRPDVRWRAFAPRDPKSLPICSRGVDWSDYLSAIGRADFDVKTFCASRRR